MKQFLLTILLLLMNSAFVQSQDWLPVGTQWSFFGTSMGQVIGDDVYTITGTETVGGKLCSVLEKTYASCDLRPKTEYLYKEDGKLYYYDSELNEFLLLHDFDVEVGDIVKIPSYPKQLFHINRDTTFVRIDSISEISVGNLNLKYFFVAKGYRNSIGNVNFSTSQIYTYNVIIEDLGSIHSFYNFLETGICDASYSIPLRSFYIPGQGTVILQDLINSNLDITQNNITLFPNPATERITIDINTNEAANILIHDSHGQLCEKLVLRPSANSINMDISKYKLGIYYITIFNEKGDVINNAEFIKN